MSKNETFSYWKKPYQKWLLLLGSILLLTTLYFRIQDFITISNPEIRNELFSQSGWENYLMQQYFSFAMNSIIISIFLGCFIIGCVVKSEKVARRSEGILLISLGGIWCIIGLLIGISTDVIALLIWIILLISILIGGIYSFWKSRRL